MSKIMVDPRPHILRLPNSLTFESGCRFVEEIHRLPLTGRHILDLSDMGWIEPFAMLHVATAVARKLVAHPELVLQARGHADKGYARFMGFFRELGVPEDVAAEPIPNHENYLPIQVLNLREVRAEASRRDLEPGQLVEKHTHSIARTLARQNHGRLWETLQYALREILRNAAEHSKGDHVLYCGQYWPSRNRVEVAILDEGIGIARSLANNPNIVVQNELEALKLSLLPGISSVAYEGAPINEANEWANSGFGLFVVSELCRRGGSLTMVSGNSGLCVSASEQTAIRAVHEGTALRLIIDTSNLRSISASLALIVHEGEKLASKLRTGGATASAASKKVVIKKFD